MSAALPLEVAHFTSRSSLQLKGRICEPKLYTHSPNLDRIVFGNTLQRDFDDNMSYNDTTGALSIRKAQLNDSGAYYCSVGFDDPGEIHLTVHSKF